MTFSVQDQNIELLTDDRVFSPSPHGTEGLGSCIRIEKGEKVLDIGTGSGILGIFAAKKGGKVIATDLSIYAVNLTKVNAEKNHVVMDIRQGDLFQPVHDQTFDVIIANVPQEVLSPKLLEKYSEDTVMGIYGGSNGNEILLRLLQDASRHMHEKTRLYVVAYAMADYRTTIQYIITHFNARLINFFTSQVKDFVYDDLEWYMGRAVEGFMSLYKKGSAYLSDLFVFELTLKQHLMLDNKETRKR
jgi:release factor glutamine methyltransferase